MADLKSYFYISKPYFHIALLLTILVNLLGAAQAQRLVFSGKGALTDYLWQHPLVYWTKNPLLRDDGGDLCIGCTVNGKKLTAEDYTAAVAVSQLGELSGHKLLQLLITTHGDTASDTPYPGSEWKLLLEQIAPNAYLKLYHLQPTGGTLESAFVIKLGKESILATNDPDGGNGGGCWQGYWWFNTAGAHPVDFSPVYDAITKAAPRNSTFQKGCYTLHLQQAKIEAPVQENKVACHAYGWLGTVTAHFRLDGSKAVPTTVTFEPTRRMRIKNACASYRKGAPGADAQRPRANTLRSGRQRRSSCPKCRQR